MLADPQNKKLIIFFAGLIGVAIVLVLGVNFLLKLVPVEEESSGRILAPPEAKVRLEGPDGKEAPVYRIIEPDAADTRPITYTAAGFSPSLVTIRASDPIGCLITVINRSSAPIRVGVNPHNPAGDPGANYGETPPGQTGILDVRYPGLTEISLHGHPNVAHEFRVIYGQGCR